MTKAVMMIKESAATETIDELKDVIAREPILIKIVPDTDFNLKFEKTVNEQIDITEETLRLMMIEAHKNDITLNEQLNRVLADAINKEKSFLGRLSPKAESSVEINEAVDAVIEDREFKAEVEARKTLGKNEVDKAISDLIQ